MHFVAVCLIVSCSHLLLLEATDLTASELARLVNMQAVCRDFVLDYHGKHGMIPHPSKLSNLFQQGPDGELEANSRELRGPSLESPFGSKWRLDVAPSGLLTALS